MSAQEAGTLFQQLSLENNIEQNREAQLRNGLKARFARLPELIELVDSGEILEYDQAWYSGAITAGPAALVLSEWKGIVHARGIEMELTAERRCGKWILTDTNAKWEKGGVGKPMISRPVESDLSWAALWPRLLEANHHLLAFALAGLQFWLLEHREGKYPRCLAPRE